MLESELFALLQGTTDAAFSVTEEGEILSWNKAAEKLLGYSAAEAVSLEGGISATGSTRLPLRPHRTDGLPGTLNIDRTGSADALPGKRSCSRQGLLR